MPSMHRFQVSVSHFAQEVNFTAFLTVPQGGQADCKCALLPGAC